MIGILCMVREFVDLVGLCPYGPLVRPCVEPERSSPQVQESPDLPRTADPEQSLVEAPHVALFSALPFEVEDISTLDDTVENDTAVFKEVEEHDLVFDNEEDCLFSAWDQEQQQADEWWGIWRGGFLRFQRRWRRYLRIVVRVLPCCGPLDIEEEGVSDVEDLSLEDDQVFTDEHDRVMIWDEEAQAAMRRIWFRRHFMKSYYSV
ncbi:unnamed protein product [Mytilus coruscus]|uniref:Uncharacterized protein n=1 Tax=Mytilus coruscus TaxID=42192 RepID=A0A6J8ESJ8_MYTCO|nr:unnamed protein product [Mytilus coruscus]